VHLAIIIVVHLMYIYKSLHNYDDCDTIQHSDPVEN
jgi:hypothetical protein